MSHRTQITLEDEQYERLRAESQRSGLGLAELVRRAVDRTYGSSRPDHLADELEATFESWQRSEDGEALVESLRRGMVRRLGGE